MELEESGGDNTSPVHKNKTPSQKSDRWNEKKASSFPPDFPSIPENEDMSPFEMLEKYEKMILEKIK